LATSSQDGGHFSQINLALEGLYTISLHFDLRVVRIGHGEGYATHRLHEALAEYADFLHGMVHHHCTGAGTNGGCTKYVEIMVA
jgi:hypothetical protein